MDKNIFIECFKEIEDPRINRTKKHLLIDIIALTLFAIMSGAQTFDEIEDFGIDHEEWLKKYLQLPNGIPSHDTINRTLALLDPEMLQKSFLDWIRNIKGYVAENVIAIDGKTMKASHQNSKGLKALHVLSAYSCANGLSLGQMKVDGKTNEITVIPQLIEQLALEGAIVTIDAMGCQKNIAQTIVSKNADYILAVKGNQKELFEPIVDTFKLTKSQNVYEHEITGDHGRIESRTLETFSADIIKSQLNLDKWANIKTIARVTYTNYSNQTEEKRYFISTIDHKQIDKIANGIRSHWQIENNLHWVLDVVFKEDDSRIRDERTALNFSWFRKMAVGLLAKDGTNISNQRKMRRNHANPENIIKGLKA